MNNPTRKITIQGMLLQGAYWYGCCTYYAFFIATLIHHGWEGSAAAGAITAMTVITMLTQPICGYISDKFLSEKKLSIILLAVAGASFLLMPLSLASGSKLIVLVNMVGAALTASQVGGLLDAWIVGLKQEFPSINYGLIRGTGSFTFALSGQISGMMTIAYGHDMRLWIGGLAFVLSALIAMAFRPARRTHQSKEEGEEIRKLGGREAITLVFSSKQYNLLLAVSFFLFLSSNTMLTLLQLIIPEMGGTAAQIGTAVLVMAGSEVPMMFLMAFMIKKFGFKKIFAFCGVFYVIRMFITAFIGTVEGLIYIQVLQGLTYAVLLPVGMSYLSQILDERIRSTAVTTYAAVTAALTGILGNLFTSALLARGFSAHTALIFFALSAFIGFLLILYGVVRKIW